MDTGHMLIPLATFPRRQGVAGRTGSGEVSSRLAENARSTASGAVDPSLDGGGRIVIGAEETIAELPQPGDVVRRLLLVPVDGLGPDASRHLATTSGRYLG